MEVTGYKLIQTKTQWDKVMKKGDFTMKRLICALLSVLMVGSLAACGSSDDKSGSEGGGQTGETKTFNWLTVRNEDSPARKAQESSIKEYIEKEGANVEVKYEVITDRPSYYQKVKILASSNELPHLFDAEGDTLTQEIAETGVLMEVDDIYKDLDYDRMLNIGLNYGRLDNGKNYCLAWENNLEYFWYHKDLFEQAGVTKTPETFDELMEVCQTLKEADITPIAVWGNEAWPLLRWMAFIPFRLQGNDYIESLKVGDAKMSDPVGIQAAEFFQEMAENYFMPGWSTASASDAREAFFNGSTAIFYIGSWEVPNFTGEDRELKDDYAYFYMPTVDGAINGQTDMWSHAGTGTAVTKKAYEDQDFKDMLKYLLNAYPEKAFYDENLYPAMTFDTTLGEMSEFDKAFLADSEALTSYGYCWDVRMDAATTEVVTKEIVNLGMGAITPEQLAEKVDAAVAENAPKYFNK